MLVEKYGWAIQKSLFAETNQNSTFSHTRENSKMFNITSKYFTFFNNKPPTSWVTHITRGFLTCYSCSYYSSMLWGISHDLFLLKMVPIQRCILKPVMELFAKLINGFQQLTTFAKTSILDVSVGSECAFAVVSDKHQYHYGMEGF